MIVRNSILNIKHNFIFKSSLMMISILSLIFFLSVYFINVDEHVKIFESFTSNIDKNLPTLSLPNIYGDQNKSIFAVQNQSDSNQNTTIYLTTIKNASSLFSTSSGNSIDVKVEPIPIPIIVKDQTKFKISFYQVNSSQIQVHVDYDFIIFKDNKEMFSAAKQIQQPLLHTAEGMVTIPYQFINPGEYDLKILIFGINFIPISLEESTFKISVN